MISFIMQKAYLHGFESKVVVVEILVIDDCGIKFFRMSHDNVVRLLRDHRTWFVVLRVDINIQIMNDLRKLLLGLFMQIRHCDTTLSATDTMNESLPSSKDSIIRMFGGHVSSSLSSKVVELNSCHSLSG
jgi:hypothetical protein